MTLTQPMHTIQNLSFQEFLTLATTPHSDTKHCASIIESTSFGGVSTAQARDLAVLGWPEGFARMSAILADLEHTLRFPQTTDLIRNDVTGQTPDVAAYLRGEPECMFQIEPQPSYDRKFVRVQIDPAYSYKTDEATIFWRGAVAIALIHALERASFSTEILLTYTNTPLYPLNHHIVHSTLITAKTAGQQLDINRITFLLAHRSAYRRLVFSVREHLSPTIRQQQGFYYPGGGYGKTHRATVPSFPADIHLTIRDMHAHSLDSAKAEFLSLLRTLPQIVADANKTAENW